jgi:hypothetical protein
MVPLFLLVAEWCIANATHPNAPAVGVLLYLSFLIPLFGPVARWTHVQLSVIIFATLLQQLWQIGSRSQPHLSALNGCTQ